MRRRCSHGSGSAQTARRRRATARKRRSSRSASTHPLALFLALATAATVFIIAIGYNHVIELFPTGGGGYRISTALLGPKPGLVSGAALLVDYVLAVATSLASKLIFERVNFLTAWLHNQTPVELQARLHVEGKQMVLLPMNVG
ncbi:hypothetical protein WL77_26245 [Burkholderia ubonensis]|nr:hypothetical protein WL77_26245 [Burkholderia ubonensis]KWE78015.1 hypothetical protein WL79_05705 [Burkholderia ubonensis]